MINNLMQSDARGFDDTAAASNADGALASAIAGMKRKQQASFSASPMNEASTNGVEAQSLGSASTDLVYVPKTPCRIVDTRAGSAGPIPAGGARNYYAYASGANPGVTGACSVTVAVAPAALAVNVTVDQRGLGTPAYAYIAVYPEGGTPSTSWMNFGPEDIKANAGVITNNTATDRFTIYASNKTHAIVDVFGVFLPPQATALDCVAGSGQSATGTNSLLTVTGTCQAGYTVTGGSCYPGQGGNTGSVVLVQSSQSNNGWSCSYHGTTINNSVSVSPRCCRVPGY